MTSELNVARDIIERFGGARRLADMLGHENVTTVHGWASRGFVPLRQIPLVMDAAQRVGVKLALEDFFRGMMVKKAAH